MDHLGRTLLITAAAIAAGIAGGFAISSILKHNTEKRIGGKFMQAHYRFSKDFDE